MCPKSRGRKKTKQKSKGRYIPKGVSNEVKSTHFFQCAWCNENLYERHHIKEYALGGEHKSENLILLCPNCHDDVHANKINEDELVLRKSTHLKNDIISGGLRINANELKVLANGILHINTPNMIVVNFESILSIELKNNSLLITTRLYDANGRLCFWMSKNRYWSSSNFNISSGLDYLEIKDKTKNNVLLINIENDIVTISGQFTFQKNLFKIPFAKYSGVTVKDGWSGLSFVTK